MSQEITLTNVGDHYEMQFGGGDSYPVPENAVETLDDDLTPEAEGESVTFIGDYGGHKHAKTFDVEEVVDGVGDDGENSEDREEADEDEVAPVAERFEVGARVENPSQRSSTEFVVVEVGRDEDLFGDAKDVLVVERADGRGGQDEIPEQYHENWRAV